MHACESTSFWRENVIGFSEKVVVTKTSYQILQVLSFCNRKRAISIKINVLTFLLKKVNWSFPWCIIFLGIRDKTFNYEISSSNLIKVSLSNGKTNSEHLCRRRFLRSNENPTITRDFVHLYEVHAPLAFYRLRSNVDLFEFFIKRIKFHFGRPKYLG